MKGWKRKEKRKTVIRMRVNTKANWRIRAHLLILSYVSDLPEAEDLSAVKIWSTISSPCCICQIYRDDLSSGIQERRIKVNKLRYRSKIRFR